MKNIKAKVSEHLRIGKKKQQAKRFFFLQNQIVAIKAAQNLLSDV